MERITRAMPWWLLAIGVTIADFLTKEFVRAELPLGAVIEVTSFFNFVSLRNSGAAFSFLADAGGWQRYFFVVLAVVVGAVLTWMLTSPQRRLDAVGYSLILGGALGNGYDRLAHAAVTDFLNVHFRSWHWPAFNVADIAICLGAIAIVVASISVGQAKRGSTSRPKTPVDLINLARLSALSQGFSCPAAVSSHNFSLCPF